MKKLIPFLALTWVLGAQAVEINYKQNTPEYLRLKVEESLKLLPEGYLNSVKRKIQFEVKAYGGDRHFGEDLCNLDEKVQLGTAKRWFNTHHIGISARLLDLAQNNSSTFDCGHKSFEQTLIATIIHEITHVKDNHEKLSTDPDFQRIVGVKSVKSSSRTEVINQNSQASPDAYELKNLSEALAVNVEYMIFDPEFECRKPSTANFLNKRLNLPLRGTCNKNFNIVTQSSYLEDNYMRPANIKPSRIYQIHYLFAGKGRALMSRWGHAMFRLVVCAPHRTTVGPECLKDVSHHLALSYRAYMSDINLSYTKGMFGGYPSQLFIMRFHEVQQEYTKFELRDLYSIPLKMTAEQKIDFLDLTLERYWTYQGKYYFINNNCGTETQKHLAVALDDDQSELIGSITPLKIYNDIIAKKNKLTEGEIDSTARSEMVANGLLIPSLYEELKGYYQYLKELGIYQDKSFDKFLKNTSAQSRLQIYQDFFSKREMDESEMRLLVMRLNFMERYFLTKFSMTLPKKAMELMNKSPTLKAEVQKMGESFKTLSIQPWQVVESNYGVPTYEEFNQRYTEFVTERLENMKASSEEQMVNLNRILGEKYFSEELIEIENFKEIKKLISRLFLGVNNNKVLIAN